MSQHHNVSHSHDHSEYGNPPAPMKTYVTTILILFGLTFLTVFVAYFDFGFLNTVIAMIIATVKASLVLMIFMHLLHDTWMNRFIMISGFFCLILLFAFAYGDIITRINVTWGN